MMNIKGIILYPVLFGIGTSIGTSLAASAYAQTQPKTGGELKQLFEPKEGLEKEITLDGKVYNIFKDEYGKFIYMQAGDSRWKLNTEFSKKDYQNTQDLNPLVMYRELLGDPNLTDRKIPSGVTYYFERTEKGQQYLTDLETRISEETPGAGVSADSSKVPSGYIKEEGDKLMLTLEQQKIRADSIAKVLVAEQARRDRLAKIAEQARADSLAKITHPHPYGLLGVYGDFTEVDKNQRSMIPEFGVGYGNVAVKVSPSWGYSQTSRDSIANGTGYAGEGSTRHKTAVNIMLEAGIPIGDILWIIGGGLSVGERAIREQLYKNGNPVGVANKDSHITLRRMIETGVDYPVNKRLILSGRVGQRGNRTFVKAGGIVKFIN